MVTSGRSGGGGSEGASGAGWGTLEGWGGTGGGKDGDGGGEGGCGGWKGSRLSVHATPGESSGSSHVRARKAAPSAAALHASARSLVRERERPLVAYVHVGKPPRHPAPPQPQWVEPAASYATSSS
jgi:hypothetical protein